MRFIIYVAAWLGVVNPFLSSQVLAQQQHKMDGKITDFDPIKKSLVLSVNQPERIVLPGGTKFQPNSIPGNDRLVPYRLKISDNVVVRFSNAPEFKDDNGKPRKMTAAENKKYRGDGRLPGYLGQISDIKKGQSVSVLVLERNIGAEKETQLILVNGVAPIIVAPVKADPKDK